MLKMNPLIEKAEVCAFYRTLLILVIFITFIPLIHIA
jgi:hypothetical protein